MQAGRTEGDGTAQGTARPISEPGTVAATAAPQPARAMAAPLLGLFAREEPAADAPLPTTDFSSLSPDLLEHIGERYLGRADLLSLRAVSRPVHASLEPLVRCIWLTSQAGRVRSVSETLELLEALPRWLWPPRQEAPLATVAGRIEYLPASQRPLAHRLIHGALLRLAPESRFAPLMILIRAMRVLGAEHRPPAFAALLQIVAANAAPERAGLLRTLALQIGQLPGPALIDAPIEQFHAVFAAIMKLPPEHRSAPLAALVSQIGRLPPSDCVDAFRQIFDASARLPTSGYAVLLEELSWYLSELPEVVRDASFERALQATLQLPPAYRSIPLGALAARLDQTSAAARASNFQRLLAALAALPAAQRGVALTALATRVNWAPLAERPASLALLLEQVEALEPAQRATPLVHLVRWIPWLPAGERPHITCRLLDAVSELPNGSMHEPLAILRFAIYGLPQADRHEARQRLDSLSNWQE